MKKYFFNIDTLGIGQCNLQCPSCPVGNSEVKNPTGLMKPELLQQILRKATQELIVTGVGLFSWTEPLLHPQLPELINIIRSFNIPSYLSSNLNLKKDFEPILKANPSSFRISVSGFNQPIYSQFHKGGNIDLVKENMKKLSEMQKKLGATTNIHVLYHRYLGNLDDEILMRDYANSLGFTFVPVWAYFMNLDKILPYLDGDESVLNEEDWTVINKMVLPFWEGTKILQPYKNMPCKLRENEMTLDHRGNVLLCCCAYDTRKHTVTNFLDLPVASIQNKKHEDLTCIKCMDHAYHVYAVAGTCGAEEINEASLNNITQYYLDKLGIFIGI